MKHLSIRKELDLAFITSLVLVLTSLALAYFSLKGIHQPLILHFSTYTGINQIGRLGDLLTFGITAIVIVGINTMLAFALKDRALILSRLIALVTIFLAVLLFIGFMAIISVNS
jgi:hypothetical protein